MHVLCHWSRFHLLLFISCKGKARVITFFRYNNRLQSPVWDSSFFPMGVTPLQSKPQVASSIVNCVPIPHGATWGQGSSALSVRGCTPTLKTSLEKEERNWLCFDCVLKSTFLQGNAICRAVVLWAWIVSVLAPMHRANRIWKDG